MSLRLVSQVSGLITVSVSAYDICLFRPLDRLSADESHTIRHVKPPRCGEASRKPRALGSDRTRAIVALAYGFSR